LHQKLVVAGSAIGSDIDFSYAKTVQPVPSRSHRLFERFLSQRQFLIRRHSRPVSAVGESGAIGFGSDCVVCNNTHHKLNAPSQIQTQADALFHVGDTRWESRKKVNAKNSYTSND
jgi:hypothetical protein